MLLKYDLLYYNTNNYSILVNKLIMYFISKVYTYFKTVIQYMINIKIPLNYDFS